MTLRIQYIGFFYPGIVQQFYAQYPKLDTLPYAEQQALFNQASFSKRDFRIAALERLGYETNEIRYNVDVLQKQWAQEHDVAYAETSWMVDITLAQIKAFQPDILYMMTCNKMFGADFIKRCRQECPSIRLVAGWRGEAAIDPAFFREHDLVLVSDPAMLKILQAHGIPVYPTKHGFEPTILQYLKGIPREQIDVGFIGQVAYGEHYHNKRARFLDTLLQHLDVTFFGSIGVLHTNENSPLIRRISRSVYFGFLHQLEQVGMQSVSQKMPRYKSMQMQRERATYTPIFERLRQHAQPPLFGLDMFKKLVTFKTCLNIHTSPQYASNMRLYEATGVGSCLVTDWKDNLSSLFEPDTEVVTYRSAEECIEKVKYLLEHDEERQAIAQAGQKRTLAEHTFDHWAKEFDQIIKKHLE